MCVFIVAHFQHDLHTVFTLVSLTCFINNAMITIIKSSDLNQTFSHGVASINRYAISIIVIISAQARPLWHHGTIISHRLLFVKDYFYDKKRRRGFMQCGVRDLLIIFYSIFHYLIGTIITFYTIITISTIMTIYTIITFGTTCAIRTIGTIGAVITIYTTFAVDITIFVFISIIAHFIFLDHCGNYLFFISRILN